MDQIYEEIKAEILTSARGVRERISPERLADGLRVSNTPVREALKRLAYEDLITNIKYEGFFTKRISETEIRDLFVLQCMLVDGSLNLLVNTPTPGMLKPSDIFRVSKHKLAELEPRSVVGLMDRLCDHIGRQTGNADIVRVITNTNERTYYFRLSECEHVAGVSDGVAVLCGTYHQRDVKNLRLRFQSFHKKRLSRLPDCIRRIRQIETHEYGQEAP